MGMERGRGRGCGGGVRSGGLWIWDELVDGGAVGLLVMALGGGEMGVFASEGKRGLRGCADLVVFFAFLGSLAALTVRVRDRGVAGGWFYRLACLERQGSLLLSCTSPPTLGETLFSSNLPNDDASTRADDQESASSFETSRYS